MNIRTEILKVNVLQQITGEILLVPELSFMTGIPDKMRKDFRAMKVKTTVSAQQVLSSRCSFIHGAQLLHVACTVLNT